MLYGPASQSADSSHARQARRRAAARRRMDLRAEVGRLSHARSFATATKCSSRVATRSRSAATSRSSSKPLIDAAARSLRARRRDRDRPRERSRLRRAATATASGRVAREDVVRADPSVDRVLRSARVGRRRSPRCAVLRTTRGAGVGARRRRAAVASHAGDARPRCRRRLVQSLRGRGSRRCDGEEGVGPLRAEQAHDAQGEARARLRLRRRRISLAQGREGRTRSVRCLLGLYNDEGKLEHVGVCSSFTDAKRRELVSFLEPYRENALDGHPWKAWAEAEASAEDDAASQTGRRKSMESGQGSVVGAAATGARRSSRVRSHAGHALSAHGAVSSLANRQGSARLHVRATRSRRRAGDRRDLCDGAVGMF